jgi:N-acetylglutamate synthase-like GNAT family acetyltransferase
VAGRAGDAAHAARLRAVFSAREGVVVGAFARVGGDGDGDGDGVPARRFPGASLVQMGFDLLAGDGDVDGKALVGYARAATDGSMVATVDEICVDNRFRDAGVGARLMEKLAFALRSREIYDVGARVPEASRTFFKKCGFGPDAEGAVLMALPAEVAEEMRNARDPKRRLKRDGKRGRGAHAARRGARGTREEVSASECDKHTIVRERAGSLEYLRSPS